MAHLVDPARIETIVGARRHRTRHIGRAVTADRAVYVLHPHACLARTPDLRDCRYARALDHGIDPAEWRPDTPVRLALVRGRVVDAWRALELHLARMLGRPNLPGGVA